MRAFDPGAVGAKTRGAIDAFDYVDGRPGLIPHVQQTNVPIGAPVIVSGWTVDPGTDGIPLAVCMLLDRARPLDARIGNASDYKLILATGDLAPGAHELRAYALGTDGHWHESAKVDFRTYRYALPASATIARSLKLQLVALPETPLRTNETLLIRGSAFDIELGCCAASIAATDDRGRMWSGPFDDDGRGFEIPIPAAVFGLGRHSLRIFGLDETGRRYANSVEAAFVIAGQ